MVSLQTNVSTRSKECSRANTTKERGHTAFRDKADQATESKQQAVREGKTEVVHVLTALRVCTALFYMVHGKVSSCKDTLRNHFELLIAITVACSIALAIPRQNQNRAILRCFSNRAIGLQIAVCLDAVQYEVDVVEDVYRTANDPSQKATGLVLPTNWLSFKLATKQVLHASARKCAPPHNT